MSNILDNDDLLISKYIRKDTPPHLPIDPLMKNRLAKEWAIDANAFIITPTIMDLTELEEAWIKFNSMIKKKRRESDWKSIELYGCTNQEQYESLRNKFLSRDISKDIDNIGDQIDKTPLIESYIDIPEDSYYTQDSINYTSIDVDKARTWAEESNRVIIIPTRTLSELEELWEAYNGMIKKHKRESDWMSEELFGISNLRHYEYLKNQFLKEDIEKDDGIYGSVIESVTINNRKKYFNEAIDESLTDTVKSLVEMASGNINTYDNTIASNIISDAIERYDSELIAPAEIIDSISCGDLPYLSPDEMIDMGVFSSTPSDNFYGVLADNSMLNDTISVKEWFQIYKNSDKALYTEFSNYASDWVSKVRTLTHELNLMKLKDINESKILAKKQSILELGWNPDIEFSNKARMIAKEMANLRMRNNFSNNKYRIIDLREFNSYTGDNILTEGYKSDLKPVYILMIEGKSYFSKAIKMMTKDIYSHVAISLDPQLHNMYSYGIQTNSHSDRRGFRKEDIVDLPVGGRLCVFVFFVSDKVYKKIEAFIDSFKDNADKTDYSFLNLATYLFNIPYNTEWKLVCSQFVDRCLQMAGIDITGKDPSQTSPSDLNKALIEEKRVYNLYEGLASKYDYKKISKLVNSLSTKATPLKEGFSWYYENEDRFISGILGNISNVNALFEMHNHIDMITNKNIKNVLEKFIFDAIDIKPIKEAKEFPIQFDKEGNLLIRNLKKIDYEAEYAKSHKLLKKYLESKNYEGIKYELSKLWMMMCMIEDTLHSDKFKKLPSYAIETSSAHKAKAKIANDFQYYLKELMKKEPSFNFTEYYDNSPFSSAQTKINASTIKVMGDIIKKFIKSI